MIDEVFRKNKTNQKIADADERFLKISPLPDGSKVVDAKSSRIAYVADPKDDKDAINKSWAVKYFKKEKDAVTKLEESATAKSAEIEDKLVKFKVDKESVERTQGELKALNEDTKTKLEEAKTKLNEALTYFKTAKEKLDKFDIDYVDTLSKASEVKANLESVKTLFNNITAMGSNIVEVYTKAKQEIEASNKAITNKANEAITTSTSALTEIKSIINDFKGKQTELNALKSSLETLKTNLEALVSTGVIDDTKTSTTQTYSSKKIEDLVKSKTDSLATIVNNQRQSITTLDSKITTTQGNLSNLATNVAGALSQKVDISVYTAFTAKTANDLNNKANKNDVPSVDTLGNTFLKKTDAESTYLKTSSPAWRNLLKADVDKDSSNSLAYILKASDGVSNINALAIATSSTSFEAPDTIIEQASSDDYSFLMFKKESPYKKAIYAQPVKNFWNYVKMQSVEAFNKSFIKGALSELDVGWRINFETTMWSLNIFAAPINLEQAVGQSGIIIVHNATNIAGWDNVYKWREVPTDLKATEIFAYFIASATEVYMGRA